MALRMEKRSIIFLITMFAVSRFFADGDSVQGAFRNEGLHFTFFPQIYTFLKTLFPWHSLLITFESPKCYWFIWTSNLICLYRAKERSSNTANIIEYQMQCSSNLTYRAGCRALCVRCFLFHPLCLLHLNKFGFVVCHLHLSSLCAHAVCGCETFKFFLSGFWNNGVCIHKV